MTFDPFIEG